MARSRRRSLRTPAFLLAAALLGFDGSHVEALSRSMVTPAGSAVQEPVSSLPTQQLLRRTLRADPQQEYFLYIPSTGGRAAPVFVTVHGISRNVEEHATLFSNYADAYGAVLVAPSFPAERYDDYQRLGRVGRGRRADEALDEIVAEVASSTGARGEKIHLFGFSGGAQFAHRYTLAHPERVARAVIGAAGWYTFPDPHTPYPYGIGPSSELPEVRFDLDAALRVPITVLVGEADLTSENLRRNDIVDRQQGVTRVERARRWVAAMRSAAAARGMPPLVDYESVPGVHHSFRQFMLEGQLGDKVFRALFGPAVRQKTELRDATVVEPRRSALDSAAPRLEICIAGGAP